MRETIAIPSAVEPSAPAVTLPVYYAVHMCEWDGTVRLPPDSIGRGNAGSKQLADTGPFQSTVCEITDLHV